MGGVVRGEQEIHLLEIGFVVRLVLVYEVSTQRVRLIHVSTHSTLYFWVCIHFNFILSALITLLHFLFIHNIYCFISS